MDETLLAEADLLYSLLPAEFVARRDQRVKELKAQDADLAAAVRSLRRPSAAAWALNLLVRRDREQVEQVLTVAVALREAQTTLDGDQLRELTRQRRQLTAAVATRAAQLTAEEGNPVSASVADQVEATLTAAMLDEGAAAALRSGLLVTPLEATGLDPVDLSRAVAVPTAAGHLAPVVEGAPTAKGRGGLRVVPDPDSGARARRTAQRALADAERALVRARGALKRSQREVDVLQAESLRIQAELDEARRKVAELETRAEAIDASLGEAEEVRDLVALDHDEAESEREGARAALDVLP